MAAIKEIIYGMIGGIIGGLAMVGVDLTMGMDDLYIDWLPRVIGMTPSADNLIIGLAMHLGIAVIYGAFFAILFDLLGREDTIVNGLAWGIIYGVVLVILAAIGFMFIIPAVISGFPTIIDLANPNLMMIAGMAAVHILYGAITGLIYVIFR
ncbi:MAG: hypothetical protein ACFFE8_13045 [Candidatus Heimdallarchaeota archaeon]